MFLSLGSIGLAMHDPQKGAGAQGMPHVMTQFSPPSVLQFIVACAGTSHEEAFWAHGSGLSCSNSTNNGDSNKKEQGLGFRI